MSRTWITINLHLELDKNDLVTNAVFSQRTFDGRKDNEKIFLVIAITETFGMKHLQRFM